jgi:hypothetical protein
MKRMFPKLDGMIVDPEHFDDEVEYICTLMSKIENKKEYAKILQYITNIENINELKDKTGKNLLMCACDTNNLSLIKYFLKRGIDINSVDNDNDNILYYIDYARDNALEILDFLIENGVNVFHKNNSGIDIFIFLKYINDITPYENVIKSIQYFLDWYGKIYVRNNFISDPNFVKNTNNVSLFGEEFIEGVLNYIDNHIINILIKLKLDIESLIKKFSKKDITTLQTNLEKSSVIEILRYRIPSELTEKLIDNLIIKEGDDFIRKIKRALILCNTLIKLVQNKRKELDILLNTKKSIIAEASLLRDIEKENKEREEKIKEEKDREEKERLKKEKKKEKEKQKKKRKRDEEFEKKSIPRELKLMDEEDTRLYYDKMSYVLAEKKIDELLSELNKLNLRDKLDKISKNRVERIVNRRERERKEREKRIQNIIIHLDDEDYAEAERIEKEDLQRELEKNDEILLILEKIYAQQERMLGF